MSEFIGQGREVFDFDDIHERLTLQLHFERNNLKREVSDLLQDQPPFFAAEECLEIARTHLSDVARDEVQVSKSSVQAEYSRLMIHDCDNKSGLESPNRFIKRRGLDSSIRPQLREARESVLKESRKRLTGVIKEDACHESCDLGVTNDQLYEDIEGHRAGIAENIRSLITEIHGIHPENPAIVHQVGSMLLKSLRLDPTLMDTPPAAFTDGQRKQLDSALLKMRSALTQWKQSPASLGRLISEQCEQAVKDFVKNEVTSHYEELVAKELDQLPERLEEAYSKVANIGPQYQSRANAIDCAETGEDEVGADEAEPAPPVRPEAQGVGVSILGNVENPFPWSADCLTQFSLMESAESKLVFCEAMVANTEDISENLRGDSKTAKKMDNLWDRIKEAELTGNATEHGHIKAVKNARFHDLTVCYFTNKSRNGHRTYYAKTNMGRFPGVARWAKEADIEEDTPLLILIAETDKAHQLKVFKELGIQRRWARGVGST